MTPLFRISVIAAVAACAAMTGAEQSSPQGQIVKGYFREYALERPTSGPAIVAVDDNDSVWVAMAKIGKLARFANGAIQMFDIGPDSRPVGLAMEHRHGQTPGALWIAASYDNKIIRFDPLTLEKREFKIDGEEGWPFNVAVGPDGSIWFTQRASNRIGRLNPADGRIRHYDVPTAGAGPAGLAVDKKSGAVWFTESYADGIGRLDPASGAVREFRMSQSSTGLTTGPAGLCIDPSGGVWFAKLEGKLGHIAPESDAVTQIDVPELAKRPAGIAAAANGDIWAVALDGNLLLRYTPVQRQFRMYPLPTGMPDLVPSSPPYARTSRPFGIALDHQGNVWFSEQYAGRLGVLDVAPPSVELFSPTGTVTSALPLLSVQALDRVAGIERLEIHIDGAPAALAQNRLDLTRIRPGKHSLEITAYDEAELSSTIKSEFSYEPGPVALYDVVYSLKPKTQAARAAQQALLLELQEFNKGPASEKLSKAKASLAELQSECDAFPSAAVASTLDFVQSHARRQLEVALIDQPPFFAPASITVNKGDTVRWRYDPPSSGHEISHALHRVAIDGTPVRSPVLRAGESFTYRFADAGKFRIVDDYTQDRDAAMLVLSK